MEGGCGVASSRVGSVKEFPGQTDGAAEVSFTFIVNMSVMGRPDFVHRTHSAHEPLVQHVCASELVLRLQK